MSSAIPRRRRREQRSNARGIPTRARRRRSTAKTSRGIPFTRRGSHYGGVLPNKITIYRGPLVRLHGHDSERLRREIRQLILHEVAHHFGISATSA